MNDLLIAMKKELEAKESEIISIQETLKTVKKELRELDKMYFKLGGRDRVIDTTEEIKEGEENV